MAFSSFSRGARRYALASALLLTTILSAGAQDRAVNVKEATADIVQARELAYGMVQIAQGFPKDGPDYKKAQIAYAFAQSSFAGWGTYVGGAIRDGSIKKLNTDSSYPTRTDTAKQKLTTFVELVESTSTGATHGAEVGSLVVEMGKAAIDLWFSYKDKSDTARAAAATQFQAETKWLTWDEIVTKQPLPQGAPTTTGGKPESPAPETKGKTKPSTPPSE